MSENWESEDEDEDEANADIGSGPDERGDAGHGSRDSLRRFYKKESNRRVREAALAFLKTLNSIERFNRPVF